MAVPASGTSYMLSSMFLMHLATPAKCSLHGIVFFEFSVLLSRFTQPWAAAGSLFGISQGISCMRYLAHECDNMLLERSLVSRDMAV